MIDYTSYTTAYSNAQAERGKFVTIDDSYLQTFGYPATGQGRFAILTKEVDPINFQDTATDAFGRLRVSNPETLFGSKLLRDKYPELWDEKLTGTSTSTHLSADVMVNMKVVANGDVAIRQTRQRFLYQPGKSNLALMTFVSAGLQTNVQKRVGMYLSSPVTPFSGIYDGIYFESNGTTNQYSFNVAKSLGENIGTDSVPQSAWNVDKLDGTGNSRITLDFNKNQIMFMDFEWLGVGSVRTGFVVDGRFYVAHIFNHANITKNVYMVSPNLPLRYEIESTGGAGQFGVICNSVVAEGGYQPTGTVRTISRGISGFSLNAIPQGDVAPLMSIQLKDLNYGSSVQLISFNIAADGALGKIYEVSIIRNATVAVDGGTWVDVPNSAIQYRINPDAARLTPDTGTVVNSYLYSLPNQALPVQEDIVEAVLALGVGIDGSKDRIDLCIRPLNGVGENKNVYCNLLFRENI